MYFGAQSSNLTSNLPKYTNIQNVNFIYLFDETYIIIIFLDALQMNHDILDYTISKSTKTHCFHICEYCEGTYIPMYQTVKKQNITVFGSFCFFFSIKY